MTEDPKRRNPNQRSYHLDDETVALLDAKAQEMTVSQSAVVRMAIRAFCGGAVPAPVAHSDLTVFRNTPEPLAGGGERGADLPSPTPPERQIVLPPENVSEFRVLKTREGEPPAVERRRPRSAFEDEGY